MESILAEILLNHVFIEGLKLCFHFIFGKALGLLTDKVTDEGFRIFVNRNFSLWEVKVARLSGQTSILGIVVEEISAQVDNQVTIIHIVRILRRSHRREAVEVRL